MGWHKGGWNKSSFYRPTSGGAPPTPPSVTFDSANKGSQITLAESGMLMTTSDPIGSSVAHGVRATSTLATLKGFRLQLVTVNTEAPAPYGLVKSTVDQELQYYTQTGTAIVEWGSFLLDTVYAGDAGVPVAGDYVGFWLKGNNLYVEINGTFSTHNGEVQNPVADTNGFPIGAGPWYPAAQASELGSWRLWVTDDPTSFVPPTGFAWMGA